MSEIPNSGAQPAVVACTGLSKHFREGAEAVRLVWVPDEPPRRRKRERSSARASHAEDEGGSKRPCTTRLSTAKSLSPKKSRSVVVSS